MKIKDARSELKIAQKKLRSVVVKILDDPVDETTPVLMDLLEVSECISTTLFRLKDGC